MKFMFIALSLSLTLVSCGRSNPSKASKAKVAEALKAQDAEIKKKEALKAKTAKKEAIDSCSAIKAKLADNYGVKTVVTLQAKKHEVKTQLVIIAEDKNCFQAVSGEWLSFNMTKQYIQDHVDDNIAAASFENSLCNGLSKTAEFQAALKKLEKANEFFMSGNKPFYFVSEKENESLSADLICPIE